MKKNIFLIILCWITIFLICHKDKEVSIEKINLGLEFNELWVTFLDLDGSNTILLSLNNTNILYVISYKDSKYLKRELNKLGANIDFIVMNKDINIDINVPKRIITKRLNINNIIFSNEIYNSIRYNNKTICINSSNCDFIYYTKNDIHINNNKVLFVSRSTYINNTLYDEWIDIYKLNKSLYTILKIKDDYQVLEIIKNI